MSKSTEPSTNESSSASDPTLSSIASEDPFTDDEITTILDDAWDELHS